MKKTLDKVNHVLYMAGRNDGLGLSTGDSAMLSRFWDLVEKRLSEADLLEIEVGPPEADRMVCRHCGAYIDGPECPRGCF